MDGAQLLEKVQNRHEDVVRIILSGQSSSDSLLRSVAPTHQCLSKPCDPDELKLRLNLAFSMRDSMSKGNVKAIVTRLRSIPSLPDLYNQLTSALSSPSTSLAQLENIIGRDMGMTAKILQLANSAFIGLRNEVWSLKQAIGLIGTETIRTLVISVHMFSQFERTTIAKSYLSSLWDHSVQVASLARQIATVENQPTDVREQSFTAGLLHDIGRAILLSELPVDYLALLRQTGTSTKQILQFESAEFGCTHCQIGAYLLSIWGMPPALVQAVSLHHQPGSGGLLQFSPVTAIHCADAIVAEQDACSVMDDGGLDIEYLQRLGLSERIPLWRSLHQAPAGQFQEGQDHARQNSARR
jgi:HD-like signal output (HDOD) protein